jgi:CRISPR-associated protein Cmr5
MPSPVQTLSQQRAAHAWKAVEDACRGNDFAEFHDQAKKLPMRIRASGLGQSFAFLSAKQKAKGLRKSIAEWCVARRLLEESDDEAVARKFRECSSSEMRVLTAEVLAYLEWIVRFADAKK